MLPNSDQFRDKLKELENQLSDPSVISSPDKLQKVSREHSHVKEIVETFDAYEKVKQGLIDSAEMLKDSTDDSEMTEMLNEELTSLKQKEEELDFKLKMLMLPQDKNEGKNMIVEIRAGTGGEEAALFAADLYRMYSKFTEKVELKIEPLSISPTGIGGLKEVIFTVSGKDAYKKFRFESGVHRVQRVPDTETSGRIHTSAVTVAVLPEAEEVDIQIDPKELRVDVYRSSGPGGQSVNTTDSAVRLTHIPSGLVVTCQDEKSQIKNKAKAMRILRSRLLEMKEREESEKRAKERREQVSTGDRSAKIRTYNYPQSRLTDHRIGYTSHNLPGIMEGDLSELVEALLAKDYEFRLKSVGSES